MGAWQHQNGIKRRSCFIMMLGSQRSPLSRQCVAWVRVRMCACAGVFARVRAHACVFMRGCVCACVVGPTCARVHACLRARASMRRVHVDARTRAGARARKCKCRHEGMRLYMCVGVRGYVHVSNAQEHKSSACCLKETTPQTGGGHL